MKRLASISWLSALTLLFCGCGASTSDPSDPFSPSPPSPPTAQAYTVLYTFNNRADGGHPSEGLVRDATGNLFGTTKTGGASGVGTVFRLDKTGNETVLYSFTDGVEGPDGSYPTGGLIMDAAGNLYGATYTGGASGFGTVFKLDTTGNETVLYSFNGGENGPDGAYPTGLVRDSAGNLYGATSRGGTSGIGTVFKLDAAGSYQVLHNFIGDSSGSGPDGAYPSAGLIRDVAGNLYGTTAMGGTLSRGTVFKLEAGGKETVLYSFAGQFFGPDDGEGPIGVIRDEAGNLYGVTSFGGASGKGTVFKLDSGGTETVLYSFSGGENGPDGESPSAGLIRDAAGNLYGIAGGGVSMGGVIFRLNVESGVNTVLHSFTVKSRDGSFPNGRLVGDNAGYLYGTTFGGGNLTSCHPSADDPEGSVFGCGVVFRLKLP